MAMAASLFCLEGTIITSVTNAKLAKTHHRKPLLFGARDKAIWLGESIDPACLMQGCTCQLVQLLRYVVRGGQGWG